MTCQKKANIFFYKPRSGLKCCENSGCGLQFTRGKMDKICRVEHLGLIPYQKAWDYQNELAGKIAEGTLAETLLLLEHPHTYTLGRRGSSENLIWSEAEMKEKGVEFIKVDRGGDITYHGPGQLVGYSLLRLAPIGWQGDRLPQVDYVGYIRRLEQVLICTLAKFEIDCFTVSGKTGVWVGDGQGDPPQKIASIGVKVDSRGISRHGFALNINTEMDYWQGIIPCGLNEVTMTSMAILRSKTIDIALVSNKIEQCFETVFNRKLVIQKSTL
jgi:lipoate-protein ligase B